MMAALQSLRFVFMMMIFMSHFAYRDMCAFDAGGDCGVAFFLILSGFVLSFRYGHEIQAGTFSRRRFLARRLLKLYPLHLLCLAFYLLVSRTPIDLTVVMNLLLLQSWIPLPDYYFSCNSVSWFLSVLFFCYLLFPFAYRRVSGRWLSGVLLVYAVVCLLVPYEKVNAILYVNPLVRFTDFYIGMVLYRIYERGLRLPSPTRVELLLTVCVAGALTVYPLVDEKFRNAPLFWLVLIPVVLVFAQGKGWLSALLRRKPMLTLASLTMPLFMIHQLLMGILMHRLPDLSLFMMLFVCILVSLSASWCIDRFFLRQISRVR